ncbi:MAG: TolC family protein [Myxococcales bacterium]|nr:TolC family protein [Myxococcales bacterium]
MVDDPLDRLVREALERNPMLRKLRFDALGTKEQISQVSTLPDPMVSIALANLPFDTRYTPMTGVQLGISQLFPFFGKRKLRGDVVRGRYQMARHRIDEARNRLRAQVKMVYYQLLYLARVKTLIRKNQGVLGELVRFVTAKYSVGIGHQADVFKARLAWAQVADDLIGLDARQRVLIARLNALRGRPSGTALSVSGALHLDRVSTSHSQWLQELEAHNPRLRTLESQAASLRSAIALARRNYYPDFRVGVMYTFRTYNALDSVKGADFIGLSLSFNLPIFAKAKLAPRVRELEARLASNRAARVELKNELDSRLRQLLIGLETKSKRVDLHRLVLIPQAKQAVLASRLGYQSNKVDFLTVLNNQLAVFKLEIALERLVAAHQAQRAALEWLVGREKR